MRLSKEVVEAMKKVGADVLKAPSGRTSTELAGAIFDVMEKARGGSGLGKGRKADRAGGVIGNGRTTAMNHAGADVLSQPVGNSPEDLAMKVYLAMSDRQKDRGS
ncbi:hypothetical protein [Reyranella sp.]|uniref:hypothetical protein n=1 Tax=Reyranella sp. TaxID=1929291 RepID=UPI001212A6C5|nr:hypothetical protein [Reyranella sp.]TAJ82901.1 MAG: hypothetical protein EPO50_24690 [Reyranella sp.]